MQATDGKPQAADDEREQRRREQCRREARKRNSATNQQAADASRGRPRLRRCLLLGLALVRHRVIAAQRNRQRGRSGPSTSRNQETSGASDTRAQRHNILAKHTLQHGANSADGKTIQAKMSVDTQRVHQAISSSTLNAMQCAANGTPTSAGQPHSTRRTAAAQQKHQTKRRAQRAGLQKL